MQQRTRSAHPAPVRAAAGNGRVADAFQQRHELLAQVRLYHIGGHLPVALGGPREAVVDDARRVLENEPRHRRVEGLQVQIDGPRLATQSPLVRTVAAALQLVLHEGGRAGVLLAAKAADATEKPGAEERLLLRGLLGLRHHRPLRHGHLAPQRRANGGHRSASTAAPLSWLHSHLRVSARHSSLLSYKTGFEWPSRGWHPRLQKCLHA